ncbi:SAM domain (Sterile alpha motif) [Carex littledalei]|uniref:SAM domain (Sterile alpha motif) n=1 Tax=Carex littledalei TaxID=544730 RepID=A0A833VZP5_9POAL|nr:SAM domain (Sterile alpha motif) [Carex littledalei]
MSFSSEDSGDYSDHSEDSTAGYYPPIKTEDDNFVERSSPITPIKTEEENFVERSLPILNTQNGIRRMRFLNFERRIRKLGGIERWLLSNGLQKFVPFFEREKWNMYILFDSSMESLEKMGVAPVGPRRKLIHAIKMLSHQQESEAQSEPSGPHKYSCGKFQESCGSNLVPCPSDWPPLLLD